MSQTGVDVAVVTGPWYRSVTSKQWHALVASNLGWLFDGYETYALILTVAVALKQLLPAVQLKAVPLYAGLTIGLTLLGWGVGGILGGIFADYFGRKKVMMWSILTYAFMTGISALSWSWTSFIILRILVGLCIGSEWGTGTSMVAEVFPMNTRAKAAGIMQSGLGIGFFIASLVWFFVGGAGPGAWRIMYLLGVLPALVLLWYRRNVDESGKWEEANSLRSQIREKHTQGISISEEEQKYAAFTMKALFSDPGLRKAAILGLLMSLTTTVGWWAISSWVPSYVGSLATTQGLSATHWSSLSGMVYNVGAIVGYILLGFLADVIGRKKTCLIYFGLSLILTPILFLWVHQLGAVLFLTAVNGLFTLGQYSWMPVWLPEFFPTPIRATGVSFVFNAARFVAFLGPLFAGYLITLLGGYSIAATLIGLIYILGFVCTFFCRETRGLPLPD
ncbi:MFS transporter [Alicyclobacillus cycloheptanicus]|uniref:MFS family permease n=1 Tax=Alicyclobacillus cycloheptanicus TaxID=1457 RepID=A0ABT9XFI3_9BACL|nr:MFS transporter [Alicyclobacillus cycloheptanicus]MDQ0189059.1 MFS family permease [Alicyclobacillus cycloheptanicus]WDM00195.1 MFS transporter [Alicyclobacillus cycloheptanicus]